MCEFFGISSKNKIVVNDLLKEFYSHSVNHSNGWGLAVFYGNSVSLEKEPVTAYQSSYLKERLNHQIEVKNMIAHIRLATRGKINFDNCHPFIMRDNYDRAWTLAHNGTIFDCPIMEQYTRTQIGQTDSERILCHIIDVINQEQTKKKRPLDAKERFQILDAIICKIAPHNKLNLVIYDSEQLYVHTNYANSLYIKGADETVMIATAPLELEGWNLVPFTTLLSISRWKISSYWQQSWS